MKNIKNANIVLLIIFFILIGTNFSWLAPNQEEQLIIGKWVNTENPGWIRSFDNYGKCYDYQNGILLDTYHYLIVRETSQNGKLKFSFLQITNVKNINDKFEYEINALTSSKLVLEYTTGLRNNLLYFNKVN
jgi:hypothetical protein